MQKSNRFVRFLSLALGVLMMFSAFASAADALPVSPAPEAEDPSDSPLTAPDAEYTVYHGPVTELSSDDKGLWIEVDTGLGHRFLVQADIPVVNGETAAAMKASDLKEGEEIFVILPANSPMTMSIPAISSSAVMIVTNPGKLNYKLDLFSHSLTSADNTLMLKDLTNTAIISPTIENPDAADVAGSEAFVLYGVSTRSIPAQTNPELIVLLRRDAEPSYETVAIDGVEYLPLRAKAEWLGFDVVWQNDTQGVTLSRGNVVCTLRIGDVNTSFAKRLVKLTSAPVLYNNTTTYVPAEYFVQLAEILQES